MDINLNNFKKTGEVKQFSLENQLINYPVYEVPVDVLRFNTQNGRISTYLNDFDKKSEDQKQKIILQILQTNGKNKLNDKFKELVDSVESQGQSEPCVALMDGTLVDGNRRYASIRYLNQTKSLERKVKVVFLESSKINEKIIKELELKLQIAITEKEEYDYLATICSYYNDVIKNKIISREDYIKSSNLDSKILQKYEKDALLTLEYLSFIGYPERWDVARKTDITSIIQELTGTVQNKTKFSDEDKENIYQISYLIGFGGHGDKVREIRNIVKKISKINEKQRSELLDNILENQYFQNTYKLINENEVDIDSNNSNGLDNKLEERFQKQQKEISNLKTKMDYKNAMFDINEQIDIVLTSTSNELDREILKLSKLSKDIHQLDFDLLKKYSHTEEVSLLVSDIKDLISKL